MTTRTRTEQIRHERDELRSQRDALYNALRAAIQDRETGEGGWLMAAEDAIDEVDAWDADDYEAQVLNEIEQHEREAFVR